MDHEIEDKHTISHTFRLAPSPREWIAYKVENGEADGVFHLYTARIYSQVEGYMLGNAVTAAVIKVESIPHMIEALQKIQKMAKEE